MERFAIKIDDKLKANLYKICRLCGIDNPKKVPILGDNAAAASDAIFDVDEPQLCQKIEILINMIIKANDKLPQTICIGCRDKINDFYDFKELCHHTEAHTRALLGLDPIKTDDKSEIVHIKDEGLVTANCSMRRGRKRKSQDLIDNNYKSSSSSLASASAEMKTESSISELNNNNDRKKKRVMEPRTTNTTTTATTKYQEIHQQQKQKQQQISKKELSLAAASSSISGTGSPIKAPKKYLRTCCVCTNRFDDKKSLDKHQKEVHIPNVNRYFCIACNLAFRNVAEMKTHQTWHKSFRMPYICGLCDAKLPNLYAYSKHLNSHVRPTPLDCRVFNRTCPKCSGSFATNYLYNIHKCAIDTKRCGGCGDTLDDQAVYLRHAPFCALAYLVESKYIHGEMTETESQVRIKNEATTETERDVDAEWSMPHKKSGKRDSAKEFKKRADKLLKSTLVTLGSIKLEPEIHLDDNRHADADAEAAAGADADADAAADVADVVAQGNEQEMSNENDYNLDHHTNNDSDDDDDVEEVDDSPTNADLAIDIADSYLEPQILLHENNGENIASRGLEIKKELLGIVPPLKLKITNKEGQLNSSFTGASSDENSSRHEKKKKKKKHRDEKRQKISYEVSHSSNPEISIKLESDLDDVVCVTDNDGNGDDTNYVYDVDDISEFLEPEPTIMTAIPMTRFDISSFERSYNVSGIDGIDVVEDAAAGSMSRFRVTARKSTAGIARLIKQELMDTTDEVVNANESRKIHIKEEPIDEDTIQIKQETLDLSEKDVPSQIPSSGFDIFVPIKQEIVVDEDKITGAAETQAAVITHNDQPQIPHIRSKGTEKLTARKSTGGINRMYQFLNSQIKQESISNDKDESTNHPEIPFFNQGPIKASYKNPCFKVTTARKSTSIAPEINPQQERISTIRIKQETIDEDDETTVVRNVSSSAVRLTARKSTAAIQFVTNQMITHSSNASSKQIVTYETPALPVHPQTQSDHDGMIHKKPFRIKQEKIDSTDDGDEPQPHSISVHPQTHSDHDGMLHKKPFRIKQEKIVSTDDGDEPQSHSLSVHPQTHSDHSDHDSMIHKKPFRIKQEKIVSTDDGDEPQSHSISVHPQTHSDHSDHNSMIHKKPLRIKQEKIDSTGDEDEPQPQAMSVCPQIPSDQDGTIHKNSFNIKQENVDSTDDDDVESQAVTQISLQKSDEDDAVKLPGRRSSIGMSQVNQEDPTSGITNIRIKQEKVDSTDDDNDDDNNDDDVEPQVVLQNPFRKSEAVTVRRTARKSTGAIPFLNRRIKQEPSSDDHQQNASEQDSTTGTSMMMTFKKPFTNHEVNVKMPQIVSVQSSASPANAVVVKEEPIYSDYSNPTEIAQELPAPPTFDCNKVVIKQENINVQQESAVVVQEIQNTNILEHSQVQECRVTDTDTADTLAADEAEEAMEDVIISHQCTEVDSSYMYINNDQSTTSLGLMITNVQSQTGVPKGDDHGDGGDGGGGLLPTATTAVATTTALPIPATIVATTTALPIPTTTVAATTTTSSSGRSNVAASLLLNNIEKCVDIVATATNYDPETFISGNVEYKKDLESEAQPVLDDFPSTSSASMVTMTTNYSNDEEEQQNVLNHELLAQNALTAAAAAAPSSSNNSQDLSIPVTTTAATTTTTTTTTTTLVGGDVQEETENEINEQQMQQQDEQSQQQQQQQQQPQLMQQQLQLAYDCNNINEIAENNNNANIERELSSTSQHQEQQQQQQQHHNNHHNEEHSQNDEDNTSNSGNI